MARDLKILEEYIATIEYVRVTYHDNEDKDFTPNDWFIFEERVRKVAKNVQIIEL